MKWIKQISYFLLLLISISVSAQNLPARPNPPKLVNDLAGVMSSDEVQRLEQKLVAYDDSTSNQIVVITVHTLDDYPIEEYATKLFRAWGIGNKKTNNGVLIVAAIDDHKLRIEVGYGLEGAIPDITANHIIDNDLKPNFRSSDYFDGFDQAADDLIKAAAGEYKAPAGYGRHGNNSGRGVGGIVFFFILFSIIAAIFRNRGGGGGGMMSRRGSGWLGPFIIGSMLGRASGGGWGGGGGGGWSGGGGGFGGFGGGSSGGGGASGSW
jgi:uncharacterized protein